MCTIIEFTDEELKPKVQIEDEFMHEWFGEAVFLFDFRFTDN